MQDETEEWRPIPRWPNHEASSLGRIRRSPKAHLMPGHVLRQYGQYTGYLAVQTIATVHTLVAEAFLGVAPSSQVANHKDGNKSNNRIDNLEWVTRSQNNHHAFEIGLRERGENHDLAKLTDAQVMEIRQSYQGRWGEQSRIAEKFGVTQGLVSQILRGQVWRHLPLGSVNEAVSHNRATGTPKVTREQVKEIKRRAATGLETHEAIAASMGVRPRIVSDIASGRRWREKPNAKRSGALGQHQSEHYRVKRGDNHPTKKLTEQQVLDIRARHTGKRGQKAAFAKEFGVSPTLISLVVSEKRRKHAKPSSPIGENGCDGAAGGTR